MTYAAMHTQDTQDTQARCIHKQATAPGATIRQRAMLVLATACMLLIGTASVVDTERTGLSGSLDGASRVISSRGRMSGSLDGASRVISSRGRNGTGAIHSDGRNNKGTIYSNGRNTHG